ncbi:histidine phosphatase family protein [Nocardioides sp. TF02-7]|uniref:histidine phosphatase family protein n=1 Tax=Nocardioides sp. TF02-7 TaxID=2917724 RepID=UPI001F063282|nr:histidine phosphatase family protein [Nocardioides sp. TF02-7]UMG93638.1 phosphoglycerate mutase family protein [Nocardioides sp. TF02-7]
MTLHLVRHGRPLTDPARRPAEWDLDPAGYDDVWALRTSGRLPAAARWFTSPEPKAVQTAQLLTEGEVGVVPGLREHVRDTADRIDDFAGTVRRAFARPEEPAYDGWEPLAACRDRVAGTVRALLAEHPADDLVLVGHGTAWTVLVAELTGAPPDLERWASLRMPDVLVV